MVMATRHQDTLYLNIADIARRWHLTGPGVLKGCIQTKLLKAYRCGREVLVKEVDLRGYEEKVLRPALKKRIEEIEERLGWLDAPMPEPPDLNFSAYGK